MRYRGRRRTWRKRGIAAVAVCLLLWCAWGVWSSYHRPVVRRWEVPLDSLERPMRLAVLADLHDADFAGELAELTAAETPDLILLDGDLLNEDSPDSGKLCGLVERLAKIAPVYYAWGNHELGYLARETSSLEEELAAAGAVVLDKSYVDVTVRGNDLRLGGLYDFAFAQDDFNTCDPKRMDQQVYQFLTNYQDTDRCKLMLAHRPDSFVFGEASVTWDVDLVISGHDHGGQVVLPLLGGLYGGDQGFFPEYIHGLYEKDSMQVAITNGLSTNRQRLPRFRNPPEIMILDLRPTH